jgi:hypothetical protein
MTDLLADAESRYTAARARRAAVEREWKALGRPMLGPGSKGQLQEHPLVAMLRYHDLLLLKLSQPLRKAHAGPEPSAVIKSFRTGRITKVEAVPTTTTKPQATKTTTKPTASRRTS